VHTGFESEGLQLAGLRTDAGGRLWYGKLNAIEYAQHRNRSHDAVIRVLRYGWQRDRGARAQGRFQAELGRGRGVDVRKITSVSGDSVELVSGLMRNPMVHGFC